MALWGQSHAGKQQDVTHQEDLELAQKGRGAELSICPSEWLPPPHTFLQREVTKNSAGLRALSEVLERETNPFDEVEALSTEQSGEKSQLFLLSGSIKVLGSPRSRVGGLSFFSHLQ